VSSALAGGLAPGIFTRELQMNGVKPQRKATSKRAALWKFDKLNAMRQRLIQRAGRLLKPQGKLTLSMAANDAIEKEFTGYLESLAQAV
jgi:hypothetical protein